MKKISLLIITFFVVILTTSAQKILLEEDVKNNYTKILKGNSREIMGHFYLEYGFVVSESEGEGIPMEYGTSHNFTSGYRYKKNLMKFYALGVDFNYIYQAYHLKQVSPEKFFPTTNLYKKEAVRFNSFGIEVFNRLNIGKSGDRIGKFIDAGFYTNYAFRIKHYTKDKNPDIQSGASTVETIRTGLNYTNSIIYGLRARVGIDNYVVSVTYRLSDLFNDKFDSEMGRLSVGLQIGLHR